MKTFRTRTVPLLLCIAAGVGVSWVSIYAFWFAIRLFHSVPVMRTADAIGSIVLLPARGVFRMFGGDQSAIFLDPTSFCGTNGLILGVFFYGLYRIVLNTRPHPPMPAARSEAKEARVEVKAG